MTSAMAQDFDGLSSAEDFFTRIGVDFDPHIVAVNRLHILKRFNQYLADETGLDAKSEDARWAIYRDCLGRAYGDFVNSSAREEKVFAVFQRGQNGFVALSAVKRPERP